MLAFPQTSNSPPRSSSDIAPYEPGAFYKRELPCILHLLQDVTEDPDAIIIDGFVTLGRGCSDGLGMHLYNALNGTTPIIGVAKRSFKDTSKECEVFRGQSLKPLFVTSAGIKLDEAMHFISTMHGDHRIPTLLKKADQLCRGIHG